MAPWKSAGWLKWKWWRFLELITIFFHKASPLKPLNLWWKNHVSQWFAFAASAFQLRKTSRELSEGSFRRSASRCSQVLIFSSPTRFLGLWSSHFDDFRNLTVWSKDPVVPKARTQAGGGRSKTPPGDFSCVESGTVSEAPGYSYAPCKSDVEAVNDRLQTGSSVGVHFQVHANCWEFRLPPIEVMNRELKVKLSQTLQRLQQTKVPWELLRWIIGSKSFWHQVIVITHCQAESQDAFFIVNSRICETQSSLSFQKTDFYLQQNRHLLSIQYPQQNQGDKVIDNCE